MVAFSAFDVFPPFFLPIWSFLFLKGLWSCCSKDPPSSCVTSSWLITSATVVFPNRVTFWSNEIWDLNNTFLGRTLVSNRTVLTIGNRKLTYYFSEASVTDNHRFSGLKQPRSQKSWLNLTGLKPSCQQGCLFLELWEKIYLFDLSRFSMQLAFP